MGWRIANYSLSDGGMLQANEGHVEGNRRL